MYCGAVEVGSADKPRGGTLGGDWCFDVWVRSRNGVGVCAPMKPMVHGLFERVGRGEQGQGLRGRGKDKVEDEKEKEDWIHSWRLGVERSPRAVD